MDSSTVNAPDGPTTKIVRGSEDKPALYREFAVVGIHENDETNFVRHIAVLAKEVYLPNDTGVEVWHMGPPLVAGEVTRSAISPSQQDSTSLMVADIVSDVDLTQDEMNAMRDWLSEVDKEQRPASHFGQYIVHPHMIWTSNEKNFPLYRKFSCAGFVLECYRNANIDLLDTQSQAFPRVVRSVLEFAYPDLFDLLGERSPESQVKLLSKFGLVGDRPWAVCLPGYLFHSLNRASSTNRRLKPHLPRNAQEASFPLETSVS